MILSSRRKTPLLRFENDQPVCDRRSLEICKEQLSRRVPTFQKLLLKASRIVTKVEDCPLPLRLKHNIHNIHRLRNLQNHHQIADFYAILHITYSLYIFILSQLQFNHRYNKYSKSDRYALTVDSQSSARDRIEYT